ncbi:MAG: tetratricopeptide repeat protein [Lacunisphaera sp.]|nr:tetratricopeptide repeat protein [Lacunisphaera sp.]
MKTTLVLCTATIWAAAIIPSASFADDRLGDELGTIQFEVSSSPAAQQHVVRGVKLLHHMMYPEADREFARAAAADPTCALAYWGRAMTLIHPLWPDIPTDADRKLGADQIRQGLACPPATARERAYLETLGAYFGDGAPGDHVAGLKALDGTWATLADQYPEDLDAVAFSALYHLAPVRFLPKDKSLRVQLQAASQLQKVTARIPDHPGAQHYKIHAYDFPLLAGRALEVCDSYSRIAPDVPHALHMPTHIFTRRGLWDKSIEFNLRSAAAARKLWQDAGMLNGHYPHALDYLAYAYLQRGQYRQAETVRRQIGSINGPYSPVQPTAMAFAFAAIPARCALERQAWAEAAVLPLHHPESFPWNARYLNCDSIVHFARAIGAARSGRLEAARAEIGEQERILRELTAAKRETYWISQAETQLLAVRAWIAFAEKKTDEAVALMRHSAELEATTDKEAVTPGEVLPAGDLLGDMLIEAGRPAEALAAYEAVLAASPNRLNTLYGAGLAAERAGRTDKATQYYQQLVTVAADSDAGLERVAHARAFIAQAGAGHSA